MIVFDAGRHIDTKTSLYGKPAGPELPAQFDRNDVCVEAAAERSRCDGRANGSSEGHIRKHRHDDSIIGRTEEGPSRNKKEARVVVVRVDAAMAATPERSSSRPREIPLVGEH